MQSHDPEGMKPYRRLLKALAISYAVMFAVMFSRVDSLAHVYPSLNQVYMTGLMVAPMSIIMLAVMRPMYPNRPLNTLLLLGGAGLTVLFLLLVRTQAGVGNRQFLQSMISHHSAAIYVCREASITDARVAELCRQIIESQEREIRQMKALLNP